MESTRQIFYGGLFQLTQGILGTMYDNGTHIWVYKLPLPVQTLEFDAQETTVGVTVINEGVSLEIHHYNITSGQMMFIFEAQG